MVRTLRIFGLLLVCDMCLAQNDSAKRVHQDSTVVLPDGALKSPRLRHDGGFNQENSVRIDVADVPPPLRKVLASPEYEGWESGRIFRNTETGDVMVEIVRPGNTATYYFDRNGELLRKP